MCPSSERTSSDIRHPSENAVIRISLSNEQTWMASSTTNSTISGGSCARYGGAASGVKRSCSDCGHYAVSSESQVRTALPCLASRPCLSYEYLADCVVLLLWLFSGLHLHCEQRLRCEDGIAVLRERRLYVLRVPDSDDRQR